MRVVFLGAKLPLTKTMLCRNGQYTVSSYPQVSKLTSTHETATTLLEFKALLVKHAALNHCLFNGQLQHPLDAESRAGKTLKNAPREWIVFDFDKIDAKDHADAVARFLPAECQNVSYIVQHSASMFLPTSKRFSGHIFMQLKEASNEKQLTAYVEHLNFALPTLRKALSLTDSGLGLHWPLDRSATYDSKLIYIAPPRCQGFNPAIDADNAIELVKKKQAVLKIPPFAPIAKHDIQTEINAKRQAAGMTTCPFRTRLFEDSEVLMDAEPGIISGIKPMGNHYIKFNLNGGDSLGYWIDLRNPAIIKNFKGEPWVMTEEVDEAFYKTLVKVAPKVTAKQPITDGLEVLAFYATNRSSTVTIGSYDAGQQILTLNRASETSARAWLSEFGIVKSGFFPHMDLIFDPTSDIQYVDSATYINTFRATPYMTRQRTQPAPSSLSDIPPLINKVLRSVLGDPIEEVYSHFINWLSFIYQTRQKSQTAWVLSGRTGTGKGTFIKYILTPLFGQEAVSVQQFGSVMKEFNGYLETALFVVFEEADTHSVANSDELMSKLRHWVTDSPIAIRRMQTDHYAPPNYSNFFLMANERTSVIVPKNDRRFNFAERQETKLIFTPNEFMALKNGNDLDAFADVLQRWNVVEADVTHIIQTKAQADVHEATTPINMLIAEAILSGDLQFFLDRAPSDAEANADFYNRFNPIGIFRGQMDTYLEAAQEGVMLVLKDEDLFTLFRTLIPDSRYFQDSKTWRRRHYKTLGLDVDKQHRMPGEWGVRQRGVGVVWQKPIGVAAPAAVADKVVDIKKPTRRKK